MFQNYGQKPEGSTSQPGAPGAVAQQRPTQMPGQAVQVPGSQNTAASQHLMLQQALQQNPELAAQLTQRLQPGNGQASPLLSATSSLKPLSVLWMPRGLSSMSHCVSDAWHWSSTVRSPKLTATATATAAAAAAANHAATTTSSSCSCWCHIWQSAEQAACKAECAFDQTDCSLLCWWYAASLTSTSSRTDSKQASCVRC